ncbi:MAG: HAD hydrolase family protein [Paludibacteraceae bacterium]|nr:HAD hydrolase family protein [Paludibacteraceae bacterium]
MNFKEYLNKIKAFVFDVDGVLSFSTMPLDANGVPMRMVNVKDGYSINLANRLGYTIGIITGCNVEAVRLRFESLGVHPENIYLGAADKIQSYEDFKKRNDLKDDEIMYMGDDIPDYKVMKIVGLPVCPEDAVPEIQSIAKYISGHKGGCGCARDVIEQTLKAQRRWTQCDEAYTW